LFTSRYRLCHYNDRQVSDVTEESKVTARSKEQVVEEFRIQTIRDAAMRVIAKSSLSEATMQQIADEAGVAKGTLYLYFQNKEELIEKTAEFSFASLHARLDEALQSEGSFREQFALIVETKIQFFHENQDFFRVYMSIRFPDGVPQRSACTKPRYSDFLEKMTAFLEKAIQRRKLRSCDPSRLALFLNEGTNAIIFRRLGEASPPTVGQDVELVVKMLLDGMELRKETH